MATGKPHAILLLPGDGIGPEVVAEGRRVLDATARRFGFRLDFAEAAIGGAAIDACGDPLPAATLAACRSAEAILLGAVGGPKWSDPNATVRPEQGLLRLREALGLYANLRPVSVHPALARLAPLKASRLRGVDLMFVRELTGGLYFGDKQRDGHSAFDGCRYTVAEIERVTRVAARLALQRSGRLTQVDKANVLETSRLWRATVSRVVASEFPTLKLEHVLVDAMAMHLMTRPASFDVVLTENLFGDILTDEASVLAGSLGLLPSASIGDGRRGLYEPIHGSAPDIAGRGIANPYATILSCALLLRHSLGHERAAAAIEAGVDAAIRAGQLTTDLRQRDPVSTETAGRYVAEWIEALPEREAG